MPLADRIIQKWNIAIVSSPGPDRSLFDVNLPRTLATAARLRSTPSSICRKVRRLEESAGHRLLDRDLRDACSRSTKR